MLMPVEEVHAMTALDVPDPQRAVARARDGDRTPVEDLETADRRAVPAQDKPTRARPHVPDPHVAIAAATDDDRAVLTPPARRAADAGLLRRQPAIAVQRR